MSDAERGQQREHKVKQRKHRQCPGHAVEPGGKIALRKQLLGQRQVRGQVDAQRAAPSGAVQGRHKAEQQAGIVGGQQPHGAAAVEHRRAGLRQGPPLRRRIGPGQKQAERRQQHKPVHTDAARPQPVGRGRAAVPALLPDVECTDGPGRQHPQKIRSRRAVRVNGRGRAAQNAHSPFSKIVTSSPLLVTPTTRVSAAPIMTSSWMAELFRPFFIRSSRVMAEPPLMFVG